MSNYAETLQAYYDAQRAHRESSEAEILRLMPEGVHAVILDMSDSPTNPRLTVVDLLDADGESLMDEYDGSDEYETLDQIAADMEGFSWDEADSFLMGDGVGRFIIKKEG